MRAHRVAGANSRVITSSNRFAVYIQSRLWLSSYRLARSQRMLAFEIYVNKVKVCTASLDDLEFVTATLSSSIDMDGRPDERKLRFSVGGMNVKHKRMYRWVHYQMQKGNRIEVRIVDAKKTDEPTEIKCSGDSCSQ